MLREALLQKYSDDGLEKIGFVLASGEVVELPNHHDDKEYGAAVSSEDLFRYCFSGEFDTVATWHTHPNQSANLTGEDHDSFKRFPQFAHYIVGNDGVRKFVVEDGVVKDET